MEKKGKVYLIGAGPGDPGLITWKGKKLLQTCDAVIYDRLVSPSLLKLTKAGCEKIYVGKEVGNHAVKQEEINRIIVEKALRYPVVVRLKGGDPYVFGRGGEEVLTLQEYDIAYEVIPGITSSIAALTYAGIPITHRGTSQSFHVITGHTAQEDSTIPEEMKSLARLSGTLVILMGLGNLEKIRDELINNGRSKDTPVAVISNATTIWQSEIRGTLEDICLKVEAANIKSPAVITIGNVAELDLRSNKNGSLAGIKVGITGTKAITDKLTERLEELDAQVELVSSSEVIEYPNNLKFENALKSVEQYQWIVFTSTNSVNICFRKIKELQIDFRRLSQIKFAVVGNGTGQALLQYGFQADFIPEQYTVTSLATQLSSQITGDEKILIPRAQQGSEDLIRILNDNHISYEDFKIYDIEENHNYPEEWKDRLGSFDYLTFASSSGVHGFMKGLVVKPQEGMLTIKVVCIGEATEATLLKYGFINILVAKEASVSGLVGRICEDHIYSVR